MCPLSRGAGGFAENIWSGIRRYFSELPSYLIAALMTVIHIVCLLIVSYALLYYYTQNVQYL